MTPDLETLPVGETHETDTDVVVERRSFLKLATGALAAVALPGSPLIGLARSNEPLSYEEFLKVVIPQAKQLVGDTSRAGQDRYLHTIASLAVQIEDVPQPEFRDGGQSDGPGTYIGFNPGGEPFVVLQWKMEPRTVVRTHAHTYGNVVTLGLDGAVRQLNYEVVGDPDFVTTESFQVRRTQVQHLTPGGVNLLNLQRDYIHGTIAGPTGGRGLDITTRLKPKPEHPVPYLQLGGVVDEGEMIFEARWTE